MILALRWMFVRHRSYAMMGWVVAYLVVCMTPDVHMPYKGVECYYDGNVVCVDEGCFYNAYIGHVAEPRSMYTKLQIPKHITLYHQRSLAGWEQTSISKVVSIECLKQHLDKGPTMGFVLISVTPAIVTGGIIIGLLLWLDSSSRPIILETQVEERDVELQEMFEGDTMKTEPINNTEFAIDGDSSDDNVEEHDNCGQDDSQSDVN